MPEPGDPQRSASAKAPLHPVCRNRTYRGSHPDARERLHVEVDHGSTSRRGGPRDRSGSSGSDAASSKSSSRSAGRPSADDLAHQIDSIISLPRLASTAGSR